MKLFQKRRDTIEIDDERLSDFVPRSEHSRSAYEPPGGTPEWNVESTPIPSIELPKKQSPNRQSIGGLVRKLNCASSKKHDYDYDYDGVYENKDHAETNSIASPPRKPASCLRQQPKPEISRPVLITVKNGGAKEQLPLQEDKGRNIQQYENDRNFQQYEKDRNFQQYERALAKNLIVRDEDVLPPTKMCTNISFKHGMSARKRAQNASKYFQQKDMDYDWGNGLVVSDGWPSNIVAEDNKEEEEKQIERRRAAQEAARRERWKRGLEMENRLARGIKPWPIMAPKQVKDDDSSNDSMTTGSNTTGTSTTGYDDESTVDDWTETTDESVKQYNYYNYPGQCTNGQQVVASVAEDFGIFAQLLFADGAACLGTAAAITKETVVSCRDSANERPVVRHIERPIRQPIEKSSKRRWRHRKQVV